MLFPLLNKYLFYCETNNESTFTKVEILSHIILDNHKTQPKNTSDHIPEVTNQAVLPQKPIFDLFDGESFSL